MSPTQIAVVAALAVLAVFDIILAVRMARLSRILKRLLASGPPPTLVETPGITHAAEVALRPPALSLWHLPPPPGSSAKTLCGLKEHRALTERVYQVDCQGCRKAVK